MKPFSELTFNPLPEAFSTNSPLTEEDQKSFSFIDVYAFLNPSIIDFLNLKYKKHSNDLLRKIQLHNSKENVILIIKSEIEDFEGDTNQVIMQILSYTAYEANKNFSTYLATIKSNPHYAKSFSPEILKGFVLFIQAGIINLDGVNLKVIENLTENDSINEDSMKETLQTFNKEALSVEIADNTLNDELSIYTSGLLEQYFAYKYIQYLEDELIQLNASTVTVTDIIWKGSDINFVQLIYSLYGAGLLTNEDNERTKLVEQVANLLGIELGPSWLNTHSRTLLEMKPKEQPKVLKLLTQGYEKIRASKIK
ncbi:hypothetical protein BWI97_02630 [Siphonobacter sp. BAB-5405]|uniref:RteC domain-containing protein n=1 Tax=Siphonobacter sp. BAB-5405 TaxID=1864825 RepID=UPI000C7F9EBF|nr:RteC domain-containing protein [Siphonobacter sp. BAB-5405]PMD99311.1 hypothetical protein BWI97_02630 [Siphonobacter sp. BAB-5405]